MVLLGFGIFAFFLTFPTCSSNESFFGMGVVQFDWA